MPGGRDPAALDPLDGFSSAFYELLEVTWAEHQALVSQLERILTIERELMEVWRVIDRQRSRRRAPGAAAGGAPDRPPPAAQERSVVTVADLPRVGKIRAKALEDAGYDLRGVAEASIEALSEVRGIGAQVAEELRTAARRAMGSEHDP